MNLIMMVAFIILIITIVMSTMMLILSKKTIMDMQKSSPFECGFNPMSYSRIPFSIHFFLIAVIFLIFDIEIILILPMIFTMKMSSVLTWMITSSSFIVILILGLMHEWNNGMINWTN